MDRLPLSRRPRRWPFLFQILRRLPDPARTLLIHVGAPKVSVGVSAVIWDMDGRVLLVHHTYRREGWGFPSGLVRRGEQPAPALARELREELAVGATVEGLLHADIDATVPHLTLYYSVRLHGTPSHDGDEIDDHRYAALDELEAYMRMSPEPWLLQAHSRRV